jgi:hypothetical protein
MLEQEISSRTAYDAYEIPLPPKKQESEIEKQSREMKEKVDRWTKALEDDQRRCAEEKARVDAIKVLSGEVNGRLEFGEMREHATIELVPTSKAADNEEKKILRNKFINQLQNLTGSGNARTCLGYTPYCQMHTN